MILAGDTMTAKERTLAVINREKPDRLPLFFMSIPAYSQTIGELKARASEFRTWFDDPLNKIRAPLTFLQDKPDRFTIRYFFGVEAQNYPVKVKDPPTFVPMILDQRGQIVDDPEEAKHLMSAPEGRWIDAHGQIQGWKTLANGYRYIWYIDGAFKTKAQVLEWYEKYGWPGDAGVRSVDIDAIHHFNAMYGDKMYLIPQIGYMQLYESCWPIMGQARFAYYSQKDPDFIHKLIESRKQAQLQVLDEIVRMKPDVVFGGDDLGQKGRSLVSPAWFDKFLARPYKEIFAKVHDELGAKIFNHSCGNITELLPNLIACGLDGWQSLEPASEIDFEALIKHFGNRLFFVGGLDSSRELTFGTPESITQHVRQQIKVLGKNGGFIPGPAHDLLDVSLDNALAMRDAVHKWNNS